VCLPSRGPVNVGTEKRKERCLDSHPQPLSNKNHKKCDELVKKRDELVTGACLRVKKRGAAGTRRAGEDGSHGGTKARRKAGCGEASAGLVASLAPLVSPYGLAVAGLMLVLRTGTPAGTGWRRVYLQLHSSLRFPARPSAPVVGGTS